MGVKAKHNPFSSKRLEQLRYRPTQITIDEMLTKLPRIAYRGEIVGPHGSGKTTLMLQLSRRLSANGHKIKHVFVNDTNPLTADARKDLSASLKPSEIVLLDGADHIGILAWKTLKRHIFNANAGLIITTHKPGMLDSLVECSTTPKLLTDIANELVPIQTSMHDDLINSIYARHNGNIRDCLWQLYDIWAENGKLNQ